MMGSRSKCCCLQSLFYCGFQTDSNGDNYTVFGWRDYGFYIPPSDMFPDLAPFESASSAISYFQNNYNMKCNLNFQNPNYANAYEILVSLNMSYNA